jgi:hypothetical protein
VQATLAEGFLALQALAREATPAHPPEKSSLRIKLRDELTHEAQKFLTYRVWKLRERQWISLSRMRSLLTMIARTP